MDPEPAHLLTLRYRSVREAHRGPRVQKFWTLAVTSQCRILNRGLRLSDAGLPHWLFFFHRDHQSAARPSDRDVDVPWPPFKVQGPFAVSVAARIDARAVVPFLSCVGAACQISSTHWAGVAAEQEEEEPTPKAPWR